MNLLNVKNLKTSFFTKQGEVQAVRGVDFEVYQGEVLGIVGESGSGKSVTSKSIMQILGTTGKIKNGEILFKGEDLLKKSNRELMKIRGKEIAMVFQDPMTALNPVYTVGKQMIDVIRKHSKMTKKEARAKAIEILKSVGVPSPEQRIQGYPHELSGGMRQRVMIAMALSCEPDLLIADEPTTALDVTIQAQILELMKNLKKEKESSIMLITHDLGVVAEVCDRIAVMYGGLIMECGKAKDIFENPNHPYTIGLMQSMPKIDQNDRLIPIEGMPPDLCDPPMGCPFANRCMDRLEICESKMPPSVEIEKGHRSNCWLNEKGRDIIE